jgi:hypothetical protein
MKLLGLFFLSASFLLALETYDIAEICDKRQQEAPIIGEAHLYFHSPIYAGTDTEYYKTAFNITVKPEDLLARVIIGLKDSNSSDLYLKQKDFQRQFNHEFHEFLPFNLFKDKKNNEIIALTFHGKLVHLKCTISAALKTKSIHSMSDLYNNLLLQVFEFPNYESRDKFLLLEKGVLTKVGENSFFHGLEGYKSLLAHTPISSLAAVGAICLKTIRERSDFVQRQTDPLFGSNARWDKRPLVEGSLEVIQNITQCMQMIIEKQQLFNNQMITSSKCVLDSSIEI